MDSLVKLVQNLFLLAFLLGVTVVAAPKFLIRWVEGNFEEKMAERDLLIIELNDEKSRLTNDIIALTETIDRLRVEHEAKNRQNEALANKNEALEKDLAVSEENLAHKTREAAEAQNLIVQKDIVIEAAQEENRVFQDSLFATQMAVAHLEDEVAALEPLAKETIRARREVQLYRLGICVLFVAAILLISLRRLIRRRNAKSGSTPIVKISSDIRKIASMLL